MVKSLRNCSSVEELLAGVRAFCLPGGEDAARAIRAIRISERGELRSAPTSRWIPFTAELELDACSSRIRCKAGGSPWRC